MTRSSVSFLKVPALCRAVLSYIVAEDPVDVDANPDYGSVGQIKKAIKRP